MRITGNDAFTALLVGAAAVLHHMRVGVFDLHQTAQATEEISRQVGDIQSGTGRAVGAIDEIGSIMREIGGVTGSIAAAIEEQGSVTRDIAQSVAQAAEGTVIAVYYTRNTYTVLFFPFFCCNNYNPVCRT